MKVLFFIIVGWLTLFGQNEAEMLYHSEKFSIFNDRVVQEEFEAVAASATYIHSTYKSAYHMPTKRALYFKFSINGQDNERFPGEDHFLILPEEGTMLTPVFRFGYSTAVDESLDPGQNIYLTSKVSLTVRLDMREVLNAFEQQGYFETKTGQRIAKDEFKGVYIAGGTLPLTWDFDLLPEKPQFKLRDEDGDGIFEITLRFKPVQEEEEQPQDTTVFRLSEDISDFPQYASSHLLIDALYNMSLQEMLLDIRDDGAFMAGAKWPGVWTRDISYSILLALAAIHPEASKKSLMAKVRNDRIIQDTGTGGSWPVSTDRMTWALAAWEIYTVTGDRDWLQTAYRIIRNSAEDDLQTALDKDTGLFFGESSFLDWREQTYPLWMDPKDIYKSRTLGTNAVHFRTYEILAAMADLLGEDSRMYREIARSVKNGINEYLWMGNSGYYGQYLYGRNFKTLSPRSETLGEALCILFGIAGDKQSGEITRKMPVTEFGPTCIFPQIPGIPPYHNNGIWPFVVAYWTWASAQAGNEPAVVHGLASIYRAAALFLTNKENMVAETGDFKGTEINSDRQLWSVAGNLATVYRVFFGMQFTPDALILKPFIPEVFQGRQVLENFPYRQARLNITVNGFGNRIQSVTLDNMPIADAVIPANLTGEHQVVIQLANEPLSPGSINLMDNFFSPPMPEVVLEDWQLHWEKIEDAKVYQVYRNGQFLTETSETTFAVEPQQFAEYQVLAVAENGLTSFLSEPVTILPPEQVMKTEAENFANKNGITAAAGEKGFIKLTKNENTRLQFEVEIPADGRYLIDFYYANGSGPINTNNRCAIRSLFLDGKKAATVVLPQRGDNQWDNWGFSNSIELKLEKGRHLFSLEFTPADENMNGEVNTALLDFVRFMRME